MGSLLLGIVTLLLMAAVSAGSAYGVFSWRIKTEQQAASAQVAAARAELRQQQAELADRMTRLEQAASAAQLLLTQNGQTTSLDAKLKEIDSLKLDLKKTQDDLDTRMKQVQQSVVDQVAKQSKETAQALAQEVKWKNLVVKAQSEVLLAQVHWSEGNRGLAKDELGQATQTLQEAMAAAPEASRAAIKESLEMGEQAKSALILEQSSARDSLNLLWHKINDLLSR
ncbi:MAG: hypothetical protein ACM3XM_04265 [Mycobacterium leprae]